MTPRGAGFSHCALSILATFLSAAVWCYYLPFSVIFWFENNIHGAELMVSLEEIKAIIGEVLQISERMDNLGADDVLLGGVPEFDSMAVVAILTTIEDNYGVMIDDDEVSAEHFESIASLLDFVNSKVG